jgi:Holliday junction resolvase-like predicted endonuclease
MSQNPSVMGSAGMRQVLEKAWKLRALIARYGAMRRLDGFNPQTRGTELNNLIAEVLDCYGIRAAASVRGYGEIDVTFTVDGTRFVLEAKWEKKKADTGKLSKLRTRVQQRLANTIGVFVSMAGYTPEAIDGVKTSGRHEMLLIDRGHLEAMTSGIVPPAELFGLLVDKASYEGRPYYSLEELLPRPVGEPVVSFGAPEGLDDLVRRTRPGVFAVEPLLHNVPVEGIGLASVTANELLLNYPDGLVRVDLDRQAPQWRAALPGCSGRTLPMSDGSLLFRRAFGIGALRDGRVHGIAGGFAGDEILFSDDDGNAWALDTGGTSGPVPDEDTNAAVVRLGSELGDESWTPTTIQGGGLVDAVWIDQDRIAAVGTRVLEVINPHTGTSTRHVHRLGATSSLCRLNDEMVLIVSDGNVVAVLGLDGRSTFPLAELDLNGPRSALCPAGDGTYFLFSTTRAPTLTRGIILRVELLLDPLTLPEATRTVSEHFRISPRGAARLSCQEGYWVDPNSLVIDPAGTPVDNLDWAPDVVVLGNPLALIHEDPDANWIEFDATIKCYPALE